MQLELTIKSEINLSWLDSFLLQLLCTGLLHRRGPSGSHHGEHRLRQDGGFKLRRANPAGVVPAAHRRAGVSPAATNQADGAHLTPAGCTNPLSVLSAWEEPPAALRVSFPRALNPPDPPPPASLGCLLWNKETNEGFSYLVFTVGWKEEYVGGVSASMLSSSMKHSKVKRQRYFWKKLSWR